MNKVVSGIKSITIIMVLVLVASSVAILSKALLSTNVNVEDFDSIFVKAIGFPAVASLYFIMIYLHNALVTKFFGKKAKMKNIQIALRFGICFAIVYILGMQEVVIEASPFTTWGIDFIVFQFFMAIGEAVVSLMLCMIISKLLLSETEYSIKPGGYHFHNKASLIILVSSAFTLQRAISYETGFVVSDVGTFPIPTYFWTILFGIGIGLCFIILYPIFRNEKSNTMLCSKIMLLTIGLSWVIFNLFIGLIFEGAMESVFRRSVLNVIVVFIASLLWSKYFNKNSIGNE